MGCNATKPRAVQQPSVENVPPPAPAASDNVKTQPDDSTKPEEPKAEVTPVESDHSDDVAENDGGDVPDEASRISFDEAPASKSDVLTEGERRRLSVSTISKEPTPEVIEKPKPIAARHYADPALALVEQERGIIHEVTVKMIDDLLVKDAQRSLIFGCPAKDIQKGFDNKHIEVINPHTCVGIGFACKKGHKPESPNQDDFFILKVNDWSLYGVFDGHGPCGHGVSNFVHNTLPFLLVGDPNFETDTLLTMKRAFRKVHHLLEAASEQPKSRLDCSLSGTTGTLVVHRDNTLYVAHVGDSRAVIGRKREDGTIQAMNLTSDHKPKREDEKRRIESMGGEVRRLEGDIPYRVFVRNRMYPGLAMSRAIGDTIGTTVGVIPDPDVSAFTLSSDDMFFTVCTDGVWEFVSSQEAVDIVCKHPRAKVQQACEALSFESWNRWLQEEDNVVDDITAIIVHLKH